jgi:hypothetical protein
MPGLRTHLAQGLIAGDAGGMDQDVDAALLRLPGIDLCLALSEVGDVEGMMADVAATFSDALEALQCLRAPFEIGSDHPMAAGCQFEADGSAKSADAAADHGKT